MENTKWNSVYLKKRFGGTWYPTEGVVRFSARYLRRRVGIEEYDIKSNVRRILDAGCGNGKHVVFFAEQGFKVYGVDISEEAIKIASAWLSLKRLKATLQVGDITSLPFPDQYFDVIISHGVLDHIAFQDAKKAVREISRTCSKGAYIYITLRSTEDSECGRGKEVGKNTFILERGYEKGLLQHFFNQSEIEQLFRGFKIFDIECHEERFPSVFTVDKAFLQSSTGEKNFIELAKPIRLNMKYSRWHIAAEKD